MEDDQQAEGSPEGDSGLPSECVLLSKACDMGSTVRIASGPLRSSWSNRTVELPREGPNETPTGRLVRLELHPRGRSILEIKGLYLMFPVDN